ncbi:MAG TPA: FAD-dependent oxidoreductase [Stellaceae bacterium]|nr:FAD-dependent oxidoreductase [Stellaceae bacterium]
MRIGILGGGLVGLVVASRCAAHARTAFECEILELEAKVGGHCQSLVVDGYTFDLGGPHILFSSNKEILEFLHRQLGDNIAQRRRNNKIWYDGRYVKYPFENGLYDLAPEDRFECLYYYLENDYPEPTNFKEWIYHVFGKGIAEKYLIPYNEKIWNISADEMAFDWVEGRVPRPPIADVIKSAVGVETEGYTHQLYFGYPKTGGIEAVPQSFAKDCRNITVNYRVRKVWRDAEKWQVSDGRTIKSYDRIVSTIPIEDLVAALPGVPEQVRRCVAGLRYNSLVTVMIGVKSSAPLPYTALYVPDTRFPFHRLSFPLNFTDQGAPPGHMAITAEITTNPGDGIHEAGDEDIARRVIDGIAEMKLIEPGDVRFCRVHWTKHAYVVRSFDYRRNLTTALDYLNSLGIVSVGRNAEFEYINMDEAVRRGLAAAEAL